MRVLAVGDVCSECGCRMLLKKLPDLKRSLCVDLTLVNGENSAVGNGITPESADMIFAAGADVITGGNHSFRRKEILPVYDENPFLLRPDNIDCETGSGYCLFDMGKRLVAVINLSGVYSLEKVGATNPFLAADKLVERARSDGAKQIFVDFHAEATSEKRAFGLYLDSAVTAVFGTHTHVLTADAQILPGGTGYITDLGMTGPVNSVLGVKSEIIINRLRNNDMSKFEAADGAAMLTGCLFETDDTTGLCVGVKTVNIKEEDC